MFHTDWLSVCVMHQPFEYNDPKEITQRSWYIYNNEVNESNKEVKIQKKEFTWTRTQVLLVVNSVPKPLD